MSEAAYSQSFGNAKLRIFSDKKEKSSKKVPQKTSRFSNPPSPTLPLSSAMPRVRPVFGYETNTGRTRGMAEGDRMKGEGELGLKKIFSIFKTIIILFQRFLILTLGMHACQ